MSETRSFNLNFYFACHTMNLKLTWDIYSITYINRIQQKKNRSEKNNYHLRGMAEA